jgi:glycosyltransferase involved in cell wall biosynthesis
MNERVRVMLLLSSLHGGGAERVAVHLLNRCDPDLVDMRMGLLRKSGPFLHGADASRIDASPIGQDWLAFEGCNSSFYRPNRLLAGAVLAPANVSNMIRAHRPHVVMSFLKGMSVLTYFVLKGLGEARPRWIAREGNNTDAVIDDEMANLTGRAVIKSLTRRCYRAADCFLANSHEMARGLQNALALDPTRMRVIHNPIDLAEVQRRAAEPLSRAQSRPFIVTAGRLEHQKGHDLLLKAYAASKAARELDLVILGRGSLEARLKRQAAELGVADKVKFPGFTSNPWAWFSRARLFVLPSRWEGFPSVVAEALACGAPTLVTACDFGPREVVEHGESGWVVPPEDAAALTAAMDMLLATPDLTARFRHLGKARAKRFDIAKMVEAYTSLFLEQAAGAGEMAIEA